MTNSEATVDHTEANKLFAGSAPEAEEAEESTQQEHQPESREASPIYLGGKKFNSVEELAKYTESLESQRASAQSQQAPEMTQKKVSDLLFEDPEKALQLHEQRIIEKMRQEEQARATEKQWWDSFYSKNKDLSQDQDVVHFAMNNNWNDLRTLHPDQAAERLADLSRKTLLRFRKTEGKREEMPSGQAKAASGTSLSAPKIQETKAAPVDFVTQLKKIQSKRK